MEKHSVRETLLRVGRAQGQRVSQIILNMTHWGTESLVSIYKSLALGRLHEGSARATVPWLRTYRRYNHHNVYDSAWSARAGGSETIRAPTYRPIQLFSQWRLWHSNAWALWSLQGQITTLSPPVVVVSGSQLSTQVTAVVLWGGSQLASSSENVLPWQRAGSV